MRIATVNVNGIRAAYRKGMGEWLAGRGLDVVTLQEVRAPEDITVKLLGDDWNVVQQVCEIKGRAGVAIAGAAEFQDVRTGLDEGVPVNTGRWVEVDLKTEQGNELTVISAYIHSGVVGTPKMDEKYAFLDLATARLQELRNTREHVVLTGDINIVHREIDIKNWKPNYKKVSGVLPEEQAYLDTWFDGQGWVDVMRQLAGEVQGPYTWWSQRGKAFDNDAGWRIDYQIATPQLAARAKSFEIDRADSYDTRWSDHAPLIIDYDI